MREVIVWERVHNILWQNLGEEAYNSLRDRLFGSLETRYDRLRRERHPEDETLFVFTLYLIDGNNRHQFEFHVDDTTTDAHVFVLDVVHTLETVS